MPIKIADRSGIGREAKLTGFWCRNCERRLPGDMFDESGSCKDCRELNEEKQKAIQKELRVQKAKEYWRANPDILRRNRLKKYGLTPDWVEERKKSQANCCAACGEQFKDNPRFTHIHHSHRTGVALGLLCSSCNTAEGFLKTADRAYRLWQYMKQTEEAGT